MPAPRSTPHTRTLGAVMRARREALGLSQEDAAAAADLDRSHYSSIERGAANPGYATLLAISDALHLRFSQLQLAVEAISDGNTR